MRSVITTLGLLVFSVLASLQCRKGDAEWSERYKRSARSDIDLFLVPEKYAVLESSWLKKTSVARYNKKQLVSALAQYGRTIDDLKKNASYEYREDGDVASMRVGRNSHSTAYDYDTHIPIVFHGKWFKPGKYTDVVYQQHITPTLAKILQVRDANGVEVPAVTAMSGEKSKPEIVVVAVIDQGGMGLHTTHADVAPNMQKLFSQSAFYTNASVGHLDAHTAVGHMAIGTGAFPRKSHVIGNTFFSAEKKAGISRLKKSEIYATSDESRVSPEELRSETLGDVLNETNGGKSVIVSQCYALRASIGMAGHGSSERFAGQTAGLTTGGSTPLRAAGVGADRGASTTDAAVRANNFVYWLDPTRSGWITDTRHYSLPRVVQSSNIMLTYNKYYPQGFEGYKVKDTKSAIENWGILMGTPAETQLEGELMRAVISEEIIQKKKSADGFSDLVYISFKSADAVGHHFGYHSLEARATFAAIDVEIGKLLEFLQKNYGDRFVFVLTADHGMAPVSEISGGARLTVEEVIESIDQLLPSEVAANQSLVKFMTVGQISLDHAVMEKYKISEEAIIGKILAFQSAGKGFFRQVLTRKDLGLGG